MNMFNFKAEDCVLPPEGIPETPEEKEMREHWEQIAREDAAQIEYEIELEGGNGRCNWWWEDLEEEGDYAD